MSAPVISQIEVDYLFQHQGAPVSLLSVVIFYAVAMYKFSVCLLQSAHLQGGCVIVLHKGLSQFTSSGRTLQMCTTIVQFAVYMASTRCILQYPGMLFILLQLPFTFF